MSFLDFTVYILGVYGLAWLLTYSKIFSPFRDIIFATNSSFLQNLITCIVCVSVWISGGLIWWYFPAEYWYTKSYTFCRCGSSFILQKTRVVTRTKRL